MQQAAAMVLWLRERVTELIARRKLRGCARVGRRPTVRGRVWIHGAGRIVLGDRVVLDGSLVPIELHAKEGAEIRIGDDVRIEGGASIEAVRSVVVGARSVLGPYCKLLDNNFHRATGERRQLPPSRAVTLLEDVVLGRRSIVLPGAHLGRGVRLEEGVVIGRRVADGAVLAGYPAKVVGEGPGPC